LQLDPRNGLAQAGLIGMLGRADPIAAETRLKNLISREPSAFLYFTLGNLYADQNQWPAAQQAYFQAHHLQPDNPDYAYNLAIGLEHLAQPKLALEYYRRATQLAANKGHANFDVATAQERIGRLERIAE
jgi:tetratricopeptide (TPR) repeat protein